MGIFNQRESERKIDAKKKERDWHQINFRKDFFSLQILD